MTRTTFTFVFFQERSARRAMFELGDLGLAPEDLHVANGVARLDTYGYFGSEHVADLIPSLNEAAETLGGEFKGFRSSEIPELISVG